MADSNAPTTTAKAVRIPDDDWNWLAEHAAETGTNRGSLVRRLITVFREDCAQHPDGGAWRLNHRLPLVADPLEGRSLANLRNRGDRDA